MDLTTAHGWSLQLRHHVPSALVLTAFVLAIAYVRSSRLKALIYSLPVPFSCAYLATGMHINATHITGLALVVLYNWLVYWLVDRARFPLIAGIVISAGIYVVGAMACRPLAVHGPWVPALVWLILWAILLACHRKSTDVDHRSRSPWWIKAPAIFTIALAVYNATRLLAGGVGLFPYAGVFTSYEMRHSLRSLAGRFLINSAGILACLLTIAAAEPYLAPPLALALSWLPVLLWTAISNRVSSNPSQGDPVCPK